MGFCCQSLDNWLGLLLRVKFRGCKLAVQILLVFASIIAIAILVGAIVTVSFIDPRTRVEVTFVSIAVVLAISFSAAVCLLMCCCNTSASRVPGDVARPLVALSSEEAPRRRTLQMPRPPRITYEGISVGSSPKLDFVQYTKDENIKLTEVHLGQRYLENYTLPSPLELECGKQHKFCSLRDILEELDSKTKFLIGESSGLGRSTVENISVDESAQTSQGTTAVFDYETDWQGDLPAPLKLQLRKKTAQSLKHRQIKKSKQLDSASGVSQHSEPTQSTVCTDTGGMFEDSKVESSQSSGSKGETTFSTKVAPFITSQLKSTARTQSSPDVQLVKMRSRSSGRETHFKAAEDKGSSVATTSEAATAGSSIQLESMGERELSLGKRKKLGKTEDSKDLLPDDEKENERESGKEKEDEV